MDRYKKLEHIANSIYAARKIHDLRSSAYKRDSSPEAPIPKTSLIGEILKVIAEHSPSSRGNNLSELADRSSQYGDVYRGMKQHLKDSRRKGLSKDIFVKSLNIMKPVLNDRQKLIVDKIMKIYDIFV